MSFDTSLKNELCKIRPSGCCKYAEIYGIMLFGRSFCEEEIGCAVDSGTAVLLQGLLERSFNITPNVKQIKDYTEVSVKGKGNRKRIIEKLSGESTEKINKNTVIKDCCAVSFVRGAFLICGSVREPKKEYRLEFSFQEKQKAEEFKKLLNSKGFKMSLNKWGNSYKLYLKDSGKVADLITFMGGSSSALKFIETKVEKEFRNIINRKNNCETANIQKTAATSLTQRRAIEKIIKKGKFETLPEKLKIVARLRIDNPEASLTELCEMSEESVSRSGMNHRIKKIMEIAEKI